MSKKQSPQCQFENKVFKAEPAVSIRKQTFCSASLTSTAVAATATTTTAAATVQAFRTVLYVICQTSEASAQCDSYNVGKGYNAGKGYNVGKD